ncbi:MAG: M28 family peptidase, partial [Candidatus Thalassarchaeum sp.]|nr:M28 family peptidase [Candidatus Thalassarchaeum sp.]
MEEQDTQPVDGMSALKLTSIIVGACIILAGLAGALLFIAVKDAVEEIGEMQEEFENSPPPSMPSAAAVVDDIEALADFGYRKIDTVAHANAGDFVQLRFEDLGYEVEVQNFTTELCEDCRNYIATMEGEDPDSWIVVGGHYDAICYSQQIVIGIEYPGCTSQGAYDDATGTASVLELARLMMEWQSNLSEALPGIDVRPKHTWKFAVWDYEEWQGSSSPESAGYGSETFVTTLPEGVEIATYINLDMYGLNWPVETQLVSQLSGCDEDYFHLYLFTSPVDDWSYYEDRGVNVTDEMREQAVALQDRLGVVLYEHLEYPTEWVTVLDDTKGNSDHYNFISRGWPATWFRGMHEFLQEEDDTCEQSPKHAPTDRVDVLYTLAGGRNGLEAGMQTGLDALALLMWSDVTGNW